MVKGTDYLKEFRRLISLQFKFTKSATGGENTCVSNSACSGDQSGLAVTQTHSKFSSSCGNQESWRNHTFSQKGHLTFFRKYFRNLCWGPYFWWIFLKNSNSDWWKLDAPILSVLRQESKHAQLKLVNEDSGNGEDLPFTNPPKTQGPQTFNQAIRCDMLRLLHIENQIISEVQLELGKRWEDSGHYVEASRCYLSAARLGDIDAMYRVGKLLLNGIGIVKDARLGRYYIEKAADLNHQEAKVQLQDIKLMESPLSSSSGGSSNF